MQTMWLRHRPAKVHDRIAGRGPPLAQAGGQATVRFTDADGNRCHSKGSCDCSDSYALTRPVPSRRATTPLPPSQRMWLARFSPEHGREGTPRWSAQAHRPTARGLDRHVVYRCGQQAIL